MVDTIGAENCRFKLGGPLMFATNAVKIAIARIGTTTAVRNPPRGYSVIRATPLRLRQTRPI